MGASDGPDRSDVSDGGGRKPRHLRPSGGYRKLRSFRIATVISDATVVFCERFLDQRSRTVDQMVQAARSGRQNIAEGSRAAATSSQTELRLVNVARASLDELLLDYEDFLYQRGHRQWTKNDTEAKEVRAVRLPVRSGENPTDRSDPPNPSDEPSQADRAADAAPYGRWLRSDNPAIVANALICLIHQANYLLDRQIAALERSFVEAGGYSEQLAAARIEQRRQVQNPTTVSCPACGKPMVVRTARHGDHPGSQFWGCSGYPACRGTRSFE